MTTPRLDFNAKALWFTLLIVAAFAGCFSSPVREEYRYFLSSPTASSAGEGPRIAIAEFTVAAGYETDRIAYRTAANELRYYGYRRWVAEPAKMMAEDTIRYLRASKRFAQVDMDEKVSGASAVLDVSIDAIEEIDHKDHTEARLAMTFVLRGIDNNSVLLQHTFDERVKCERHPRAVAAALSGIYAKQMQRIAERIASVLAMRSKDASSLRRESPCKKPHA